MKKNKFRFIRKIILYFFILVFGGLFFLFGLFIYYAGQIPDPASIASRRVSESTKIYDRTGKILLYDVHGDEKRTIVAWEQISPLIKKATLASEDNEFYSHKGFDILGILRAVYKDIVGFRASQGGSTITQQLIKKALLGDEKTIARKIKEIALSVEVERRFTKDQIFWMYLNQIPYGSNIYGIESASWTFFGKHAIDLDLAESALLAALPKAPSYYSPYGNHVGELIGRRNNVLNRMQSLGYITKTDYENTIKTTPKFQPLRDNISAPHFSLMVRDYLAAKYGEDLVENGGLNVTTTLDMRLQEIAEEVIVKYGKINEKYKATNAALVANDPKTGQILTMVGSRDYFDIANEGNFNVALASRQPGSSFKPFAYAAFFEKGFTDSTVLFDLPTEFNPNCPATATAIYDSFGIKCYNPQNYDGRFRGPVTPRQALAQSLNVPSVQVLYLANIENTLELAHKLGITTLNDRNRYGLSLVLGGGEVRLVDMATAYGVFLNDGVGRSQSFILKVVASDGTILEEYKNDDQLVIDPQIARLITDILSDNNARGPVFGYNSSLHFPDRPVAAKTGTTQENRDGWLVGGTPSLAVGVWTGNNNNKSMTKEGAGLSAAGPLWHEFLTRALVGTPPEEFIKPDPLESNKPILNGVYMNPEGVHSILFFVDKDSPTGSPPLFPGNDPQFKNWEDAVFRWTQSLIPN